MDIEQLAITQNQKMHILTLMHKRKKKLSDINKGLEKTFQKSSLSQLTFGEAERILRSLENVKESYE